MRGSLALGIIDGIRLGMAIDNQRLRREAFTQQQDAAGQQLELTRLEIERIKDEKSRRAQLRDIGVVEHAIKTGVFSPAVGEAYNRIYDIQLNQGGPEGARKRVVRAVPSQDGQGFYQEAEITTPDGQTRVAPLTVPNRDETDSEVMFTSFEDAFKDLHLRKQLIQDIAAKRIGLGDNSPLTTLQAQQANQAKQQHELAKIDRAGRWKEKSNAERAHELAKIDRKGQWDVQAAGIRATKGGSRGAQQQVKTIIQEARKRAVQDHGSQLGDTWSFAEGKANDAGFQSVLTTTLVLGQGGDVGTLPAANMRARQLLQEYKTQAGARAEQEAQLLVAQDKLDDDKADAWKTQRVVDIVRAQITQFATQNGAGDLLLPQKKSLKKAKAGLSDAQPTTPATPSLSDIQLLISNPSDQRQSQFDQIYGTGAAKAVLQKAR